MSAKLPFAEHRRGSVAQLAGRGLLGVLLALWLAACADATTPTEEPTPDADLADVQVDADRNRDGTVSPDEGPGDAIVLPDQGLPADMGGFEIPPQVVAVETRLGLSTTAAGLANRVTCEPQDARGVTVPGLDTRFEVRPEQGWSLDETLTSVIGETVGVYQITCTIPGLGLRDSTPERWDVDPGAPDTVFTQVEPTLMEAGGVAQVSCTALDALGNPVNADAATVEVQPTGDGVVVDGHQVTVTRAGRYLVTCALPGARYTVEQTLDVLPGLPAELVAEIEPARPVFDVGTVITYETIVTDAFGNRVDTAPLVWGSDPPMPSFGEGRFRPASEGRYHLWVQVEGDTAGGRILRQDTSVVVDSGGPVITCTRPALMVSRAATRLEGDAQDELGIAQLFVDGIQVPMGEDGHFSVPVTPRWGLNIHQLIAVDEVGNENSTFCAYFAADSYLGEDAQLSDAIVLHLGQGALDDGAPGTPIRSITDLLRRVVDSPELRNTIDATLRAQNPVVPEECRQSGPFGWCLLRLGAEYRGLSIGGPNTFAATLINGGIRVQAQISNLDLSVKLLGTLTNTGTISAEYVRVDLNFGVSLVNGRPQVALTQTNAVEVGDLSSDFDGIITGTLLDLVFWAFEGTIREEVTAAMTNFLETEVDTMLSGILSGLDLATLGLAFEVPPLLGNDATPLSFGLAFSALDVNARRLKIGVGTRVNGPTRQGLSSAGVPLPPGSVSIELNPRGTVAGAVHLGLLNQALHRAWRAGLFQIPDASALVGDLPEGTSIALRVLVPPAVKGTGNNGTIELHLGPAVGELVYPGLIDEPVTLRLAAIATASVQLVNGDELRFEGVSLRQIEVAIDGATVSEEARQAITDDLQHICQSLIDHYLNGLLPVLPIPDFALPDTLSAYGVPAGTRLGLREARLTGTESHLIVDGVFRE